MNNRKVGFIIAWLLLVIASLACGGATVSPSAQKTATVANNVTPEDDVESTPVAVNESPQETAIITNDASSLIVSQVTDPESDIGIIVTESSQQEIFLISGEKDAQGKLRSITTMRLSSLTEEDKWVELQFNSDKLPDSVTLSNGVVAKLSNYTDTSVDISFYYSIDQIYPTITQEIDVEKVRALQKRLQQDNIYTRGRNVFPLPVNGTHQVKRPIVPQLVMYGNDMQTAIEVQGYRRYEDLSCEDLKLLDELVWIASQTFSVIMCGLSVAADVASIGIATPLTVWACGSVVVSGMSKMIQVLDQDNSRTTQAICHANNLNNWANLGVSCIKKPIDLGCLVGAGTLVYDIWRRNGCQNSDCATPTPPPDPCQPMMDFCSDWLTKGAMDYGCTCQFAGGYGDGVPFSEACLQRGFDWTSMGGMSVVNCDMPDDWTPPEPPDDSDDPPPPPDDPTPPPDDPAPPPDDPAPPPEPPAGGDDSPPAGGDDSPPAGGDESPPAGGDESPPASPGSDVLFEDNFDGSTLDILKWLPANFAGEVTVGNGFLRLASSGPEYPYIYTQQNPFPATGNFEMVAQFRYSQVNDCGVGILMSSTVVPMGLSQEEAGRLQEQAEQNGMSAGVWQDLANGLQIWYRAAADRFDGQLGGPDTVQHEMKIRYVANRYEIYLDGADVYTSDETTFRPTAIWMGHPANLGSPCLWSTLEVDSITVRALP